MIELNDKKAERAILVGVSGISGNNWEVEEYLDELALLADTAGAEIVERLVQDRKQVDATYFIGRGKAEFLANLAQELDVDLIIFDDDLSPAQARNLSKLCDKKVIDRSGLILDIFAGRAKSREARTQVELAQLRYLLPRLTRQWTHLSRQVGGIGTRGPGETQLEVDRRLIRTRIAFLARELEKIENQRKLRREHRDGVFKAALIGYTNVGKSTLFNALTASEVFVENRLFATLDATVRGLQIADHDYMLLIDTVGFIRKLPHHLIASFKSTLEEARDATLLVHIIDITHPYFEDQILTVAKVLQEMALNEAPQLFVFNKIDALDNPGLIAAMREKYSPSVFVSAARGLFLEDLKNILQQFAHANEERLHLKLQAADGEALARIYALAEVIERNYQDDQVVLWARTTPEKAAKLRAYARKKDNAIEFIPG